jgi:hypothetical protein
MHFDKLRTTLCATVIAAAAVSAGCRGSKPVQFTIGVPQPNTVAFQANLMQSYGVDLAGTFVLPKDYGSITLVPESATTGMGIGMTLNTGAFVPANWAEYQEVTTLPTGTAFPLWMEGPVVDVNLPEFDTGPVSYHAYLGVRGQWYVGVAGLIDQIDEDFPAVNIGYTFRDSKGNVVVGLKFFGPKLGEDGHAEVPGGIFVGTNLSPLLAGILPAQNGQVSSPVVTPEMMEKFNDAANSGKPITLDGHTVLVQRLVSGPDSGAYRSNKRIQGLLNRYLTALRNAQ